MPQTAPQTRSASGRVEAFQYPADSASTTPPGWECWTQPVASVDDQEDEDASAEAALRAEFELRLAGEVHRAFEAGREKGRQEGRSAEHQSQSAAQSAALSGAAADRIRQTTELLQAFARERDRLLAAVEDEAVHLALAIAARILRREAQMDPLLLTGAVRVALGQLPASTQVTLKVPPAELDLWTEAMALVPNLGLKPVVVAGDGMRLGDCQVETTMGSVDLGIRSQLGEIERGFFDRAGQARTQAPVAAQHLASGQDEHLSRPSDGSSA